MPKSAETKQVDVRYRATEKELESESPVIEPRSRTIGPSGKNRDRRAVGPSDGDGGPI